MTAIAQAIQGLWGRAVLQRRVEAMERFGERARRMLEALRNTILQLQANNEALSKQVVAFETENGELKKAVAQMQAALYRVDENAKCPNCGHTDGFLTHAVSKAGADFEIRPVNNCKKCGISFVSSGPVAGDDAGKYYQAPQELVMPGVTGARRV